MRDAARVRLRERPDLALLDVVMPGLDGLRVAEVLRDKLGGEVRVAFISGRGRFETSSRGSSGAPRSTDAADLVEPVQELLRHRR